MNIFERQYTTVHESLRIIVSIIIINLFWFTIEYYKKRFKLYECMIKYLSFASSVIIILYNINII